MSFTPPPPDPPWFRDLVGDVDRAFEATGAGTPGWPDPHPDHVVEDEEYSRVTDPGKYRILDTRLDAWVQVLAARAIAAADDVPATAWHDSVREPEQLDRVRRLQGRVPGALSLLLGRTLVDGEPFGLDLALAQGEAQPLLVTSIPRCGCDACDDGSAELLTELDGWILTVARGGVVAARSAHGRVTRRVDGWLGSGEAVEAADLETWLTGSTSSPPGVTRWVGAPWL